MAGCVLPTPCTGTAAHGAIEAKGSGVAPYLLEAVLVQVTRLKFWCLEKGARIDLSFGADTAGGGGSTTDIKSWQLLAEGVEVKE